MNNDQERKNFEVWAKANGQPRFRDRDGNYEYGNV